MHLIVFVLCDLICNACSELMESVFLDAFNFKILLLKYYCPGGIWKMCKIPLRLKASKNVYSEIRFTLTELVWIL